MGSSNNHSGEGSLEAGLMEGVSVEQVRDRLLAYRRSLLAEALLYPLPHRVSEVERQQLYMRALASLECVEEAYDTLIDVINSTTPADTEALRRRVRWVAQRLGLALRDIGLAPTLPSETPAARVPAPAQDPHPEPPPAALPPAPVETPGVLAKPTPAPSRTVCGKCGDVLQKAPDPTKPPGEQDVVLVYCKCWEERDPGDVHYVDHKLAFQAATNPRRRFTVHDGEGVATKKIRGHLSLVR